MAAPRCKPVCSAEGRTCRRVCVFAGMLHACRAVCWGTPGACTPYALLCRGVRSARATRLAAATSNHTLALYPQGTDCFCHRRRRGGAGSGRWVCGWCSRRDEGGGRQWQARGRVRPPGPRQRGPDPGSSGASQREEHQVGGRRVVQVRNMRFLSLRVSRAWPPGWILDPGSTPACDSRGYRDGEGCVQGNV